MLWLAAQIQKNSILPQLLSPGRKLCQLQNPRFSGFFSFGKLQPTQDKSHIGGINCTEKFGCSCMLLELILKIRRHDQLIHIIHEIPQTRFLGQFNGSITLLVYLALFDEFGSAVFISFGPMLHSAGRNQLHLPGIIQLLSDAIDPTKTDQFVQDLSRGKVFFRNNFQKKVTSQMLSSCPRFFSSQAFNSALEETSTLRKLSVWSISNGPGIATVPELRASSLSAETKTQAEQQPQNYHQAPLLWLYHVLRFYSIVNEIFLPNPNSNIR